MHENGTERVQAVKDYVVAAVQGWTQWQKSERSFEKSDY